MERATYATKSFIIAIALVRKYLTVEQASLTAQVEVASQIQRWGEVEDCKSLSSQFLQFFSRAYDLLIAHDVDFHDIRRQLGSAACLSCAV
jgi:ATP synthase F1 complex assembly factor 2